MLHNGDKTTQHSVRKNPKLIANTTASATNRRHCLEDGRREWRATRQTPSVFHSSSFSLEATNELEQAGVGHNRTNI